MCSALFSFSPSPFRPLTRVFGPVLFLSLSPVYRLMNLAIAQNMARSRIHASGPGGQREQGLVIGGVGLHRVVRFSSSSLPSLLSHRTSSACGLLVPRSRLVFLRVVTSFLGLLCALSLISLVATSFLRLSCALFPPCVSGVDVLCVGVPSSSSSSFLYSCRFVSSSRLVVVWAFLATGAHPQVSGTWAPLTDIRNYEGMCAPVRSI